MINKIKVLTLACLAVLHCLQMRAAYEVNIEQQIGVIPILNIPVTVHNGEWSSSFKKIYIAHTALLHGALASASTTQSIPLKIVHHGLLWGASHGIGAIQTLCHELGHAVIDRNTRNAHIFEIGIVGGNYTTLISGAYGGYTVSGTVPPSIQLCDQADTMVTKEDCLTYIDAYDKYQLNTIKVLLAGPVSGTISGYTMLKFIQRRCPTLFQNRWFKGACILSICNQLENFLPLSSSLDGPRAYEAWQQRSEMLKTKAYIQEKSDETLVKIVHVIKD